jgi:hypothetical protein
MGSTRRTILKSERKRLEKGALEISNLQHHHGETFLWSGDLDYIKHVLSPGMHWLEDIEDALEIADEYQSIQRLARQGAL